MLSPWVLYFSAWYDATLRSAYLHEAMHVHLVLVGSLFLWPLVGRDPVPGRVAYPFRMMLLVMTLPFHAFLGLTIMNQDALIAGEWYRSLTLPLAARPGRGPASWPAASSGAPATSSARRSSSCSSRSGRARR